MRVAAGLMLLVAVVAFLVQMALLLTNREFNFLHHNAIIGHGSIEGDAENDEENDRADTGPKRRLEYNYSDEPRTNQQIEDSRTSEQTDDRRHHSGPIVQPSTLRGEGNEWTDT
ncbi:uncharacterized protein KY384_008091 [Bacidia gigantensis]|uniref:uncharacterized protein n=1 Tax=Bacidia gigantensis TaxID=2732470 RepID=UPI001D04B75B|nr:uncharacterized protein KY384_008091 [Bacidia gigantensis]KAG8526662.1 hypothetical protein KY384_008091 [Bacidia gigantensis]